MERRPLAPQEREGLPEGGLEICGHGIELSAPGLADGQKDEHSQQHSGHAKSQERRTPAVGLGDGTRVPKDDPRVTAARIRIQKPQALAPDAKAAGVELTLTR